MNAVTTIDRADANRAYGVGEAAGRGFLPGSDGDDTLRDAIAYALRNGWVVVHEREWSGDLAVLRHDDGKWVAIGGDDMGHNAWAVDVTSAAK